MKNKALLIICDGWGIGSGRKDDVIAVTPTPYWDSLLASYPHSQLQASGENVGLPDGQMGNSEVGHLNIGAGRVVYQDLVKINRACADGSLAKNQVLVDALAHAKRNNKKVHLMGLVSTGGVHSSMTHMFKLIDIAKEYGLEGKTFVHCFMDGRDTDPKSGKGFIADVENHMQEVGCGVIASIIGRFYAMDRDKRWERVKVAYDQLIAGEGKQSDNMVQAMQESYDEGVTDEFMLPTVCDKDGRIQSGDSVIFLNFRPDRSRELSHALTDEEFAPFERREGFFPLHYVCTTEYDATMPNVTVAYPRQKLDNIFGEYISKLGLTQLRIAETEKYAHVTFFFNGGREEPYALEDRCLIPSPRDYATYDLIPEMSGCKAEECAARFRSGKYDAVICNLANCDMVGHTAVRDAVIRAVETVDACVGTIVEAVREMGGTALITADHGNADNILSPDGSPDTAHTTNPVPLIVAGAEVTLRPGRLADLAPTLLELMGLPQPAEMTGVSLLSRE